MGRNQCFGACGSEPNGHSAGGHMPLRPLNFFRALSYGPMESWPCMVMALYSYGWILLLEPLQLGVAQSYGRI